MRDSRASLLVKISIILQLITLWFVALVFIQVDTPTSNDLIMIMRPITDLVVGVIPVLILVIVVSLFAK
jgi:hypothetical protein